MDEFYIRVKKITDFTGDKMVLKKDHDFKDILWFFINNQENLVKDWEERWLKNDYCYLTEFKGPTVYCTVDDFISSSYLNFQMEFSTIFSYDKKRFSECLKKFAKEKGWKDTDYIMWSKIKKDL